ncbi:MAG: DUF3788 domain-containing protein [Promethearchaeota archaeon]
MTENESQKRMFNRTQKPTESDITSFIADSEAIKAWNQLVEYLDTNYELKKEILYYGDKYGWLVRYRKSKRTIVSLFPEKQSFSFLIVYGKKEIDKFLTSQSEFQPSILKVFKNTEKLHDGKWLWIRVSDSSLFEDLKQLLAIKRKPK